MSKTLIHKHIIHTTIWRKRNRLRPGASSSPTKRERESSKACWVCSLDSRAMSMDKNFLGVKFSNSTVDLVGDEEPVHGSKDSDAYMRNLGMQRPLFNKVSILPQFRPYKTHQDEKSKMVMLEPYVTPPSVPVATPDAWHSQWGHRASDIPKPAVASPQLTIFYGGSVRVFDNVAPEKARAIMHLAQNLATVNMSAPPCSAVSSPISVTSQPNAQSGSGSCSNDEVMVIKPIVSVVPNNNTEPPVSAAPRIPAEMLNFSAVPQARNASLKRFLEKRKERLTNTTPYNIGTKNSPSCSTSPASEGVSLSESSGLSTAAVSQGQTWISSLAKTSDNSEKVNTTLGL